MLSEGEGPAPQHGTLLAPGLNAQHHQHFFCARLDPAVDDPAGGAALTVVEVRFACAEGFVLKLYCKCLLGGRQQSCVGIRSISSLAIIVVYLCNFDPAAKQLCWRARLSPPNNDSLPQG